MEDGQQNSMKVLFIIQARMRSTRLPGKVLLPIPYGSGKPVIQWIIESLQLTGYFSEVIVATSVNKENDVLFEFCNERSINCYRGDEENVLSRFIEIVKNNPCDAVVRLTGDNPVIDQDSLEQTLNFHFSNSNEYTKTEGLPLGMNFEVIAPQALLSLENEELTGYDTEHVTPFIINNKRFVKKYFRPQVNEVLKDLRLTLDYPSDYLVLSAVLTLALKSALKGVPLIMKALHEFPWVFEVNNANVQKMQYPDLETELAAAAKLLESYDLKKAAEVLYSYRNETGLINKKDNSV